MNIKPIREISMISEEYPNDKEKINNDKQIKILKSLGELVDYIYGSENTQDDEVKVIAKIAEELLTDIMGSSTNEIDSHIPFVLIKLKAIRTRINDKSNSFSSEERLKLANLVNDRIIDINKLNPKENVKLYRVDDGNLVPQVRELPETEVE